MSLIINGGFILKWRHNCCIFREIPTTFSSSFSSVIFLLSYNCSVFLKVDQMIIKVMKCVYFQGQLSSTNIYISPEHVGFPSTFLAHFPTITTTTTTTHTITLYLSYSISFRNSFLFFNWENFLFFLFFLLLIYFDKQINKQN